MAKDVEIIEGGQLMDPSGEAFNTMLAQAQTRSEEALAVKEDTTTVEETGVKTTPGSPPEPDPIVEPEDLKAKLAGLQAELARVRKQKSGGEGEAASLKEALANLEGQVKVLRESKTTATLEERVAALSDEQVQDNEILWRDELTDARVLARMAERDNDPDGVAKANARIDTARKMQKLYDTVQRTRSVTQAETVKAQGEYKNVLSTEVDTLFNTTYASIPELKDTESEIWKAGQVEYKLYPTLMKQLGPLGEMIAVASAVAKNPQLVSKKSAAKLLADIEDVADKTFQKGGTAPRMALSKPTVVNSQKDLSDFEAQVAAIKLG